MVGPTNLTQDLVCYWGMEETGINDRIDSRGNADLTPSGVGTGTGVKGFNASLFDGIDDILSLWGPDISGATRMDHAGSFTVGAWIYLDKVTGVQVVMERWSLDAAPGIQKEFKLTLEGNQFRFKVFNVSESPTAYLVTADDFGPASVGTWYLVIGYYDATPGNPKIGIGINNVWTVAVGPEGGIDTYYTTPFGMGANWLTGQWIDGIIDEAFIYKRLLSYEEKTWYYNDAVGRVYPEVLALSYSMEHPTTSMMQAYWRMEELSGNRLDEVVGPFNNILYDATGVGYDNGMRRGIAAKFIKTNSDTLYSEDTLGALRMSGMGESTIGCWIKPSTLSGVQVIVSKWDPVGQKEYKLWIDDNRVYFAVHDGISTYSVEARSFGSLSVDTWYYISCFSGYVNFIRKTGVSVNNVWDIGDGPIGGVATGSNYVYIGSDEGTVNFYDGLIDELFFASTKYTDEENMFPYYYGFGRTWESWQNYAPPVVPFDPNPPLGERDIFVLDSNLSVVELIDDHTSLIWTDRFYEPGEVELTLPASYWSNINITVDNFLFFKGSDQVMIIESVMPSEDESSSEVKVMGRSAEAIFERRVIPDPLVLSAPTELVLHELLLDNITGPSDPQRIISVFDTEVPALLLQSIHAAEYERQSLYSVMEAMGRATNLGLNVVRKNVEWPVVGAPTLYFHVSAGIDRSTGQTANLPVIFSENLDNVVSSSVYLSDKGRLTAVLVITDDAEPLLQKNFVWFGGTDYDGGGYEPTGLDRREGLLETTVDRGTPPLTDIEVHTIIAARGNDEINKSPAHALFDGEFDVHGLYKYGIDFFMGDIVQCNIHGLSVAARLVELVRSYTPAGASSNVTFDFLM